MTRATLWNRAVEVMTRDRLHDLQLSRLRALVARVSTTSPFYKYVLADAGVVPRDLATLDHLARLPFTTKSDLRDCYPWDMLAVPKREVIRIHASSGTTGKPTVVAYSRQDMKTWAEIMARTMTAVGVTRNDVVHNAAMYGLFTGGLGLGLGAETVGATTIPASGGFTRRQLMLMEDFGATVLCCTPSYALVLAEAAAREGIDVGTRLKLRAGVFGAEPWTEGMRLELETRLGLEAFDVYGLSEIIGPGVSYECAAHDGLHIQEDHFLPEIIDPDTGEVLPDGAEGELVLTTLTKVAMPLIRYRTRDRARLMTEPCGCGRTLRRMSRVHARTDDMLIVHGVNVFPSQIETALLRVPELAPHYVIAVDRNDRGMTERLEVYVEPEETIYRSGAFAGRDIQKRTRDLLRDALGIHVTLTVVEPHQIERSQGKAARVVDRRGFQPRSIAYE